MSMVKQMTASGPVTQPGPGARYWGFTIAVTTATAAINVRNGSATAAILDVIATGSTAANARVYGTPLDFNAGIWADFNGGTGTVNFIFE